MVIMMVALNEIIIHLKGIAFGFMEDALFFFLFIESSGLMSGIMLLSIHIDVIRKDRSEFINLPLNSAEFNIIGIIFLLYYIFVILITHN